MRFFFCRGFCDLFCNFCLFYFFFFHKLKEFPWGAPMPLFLFLCQPIRCQFFHHEATPLLCG